MLLIFFKESTERPEAILDAVLSRRVERSTEAFSLVTEIVCGIILFFSPKLQNMMEVCRGLLLSEHSLE